MRRNREEEEGNAREEGGVRTKTAPSSFALSEAFCVLYLSVGANRGSSFSPKGEQAQKKIEKKLAQAPKENFCDRRSLQNQTAPRREKKKRRKKEVLFSAFSASPLFLSLQNRPRASSKPASLSLLRRANPVGSRWIPRCTFCSTGSKRKRSKGNFGSRSLLRGTRGRERVKFFSFFSLGFERRRSSRGHRRETRDKKRRKKKFELALELWRVFVGNEREEEEKINRKWRPTGPRRRAKAGNGGRGKATRIFLSGKS